MSFFDFIVDIIWGISEVWLAREKDGNGEPDERAEQDMDRTGRGDGEAGKRKRE
jgi:hypothetical protein